MDDTQRVVDRWLREMPTAGDEALRLDENGICALEFEGQVGIVVEAPEGLGTVLVYSPLGPIPEDPEAAADLLAKAMARNLFLAATGGGALGFDPESGLLALSFLEDVERTDQERLADVIALCCRKTTEFRRDLLGGDVAADPPQADPRPGATIRG